MSTTSVNLRVPMVCVLLFTSACESDEKWLERLRLAEANQAVAQLRLRDYSKMVESLTFARMDHVSDSLGPKRYKELSSAETDSLIFRWPAVRAYNDSLRAVDKELGLAELEVRKIRARRP